MFGKRKRRRQAAAGLAVIIIGLSLCEWIWEGYAKDYFVPRRWGVVEEGNVYRSGRLSASLVKGMLEDYSIRVVVDLGNDKKSDRDCLAEIESAAALGIERINLPLKGNGTGDIHNYAKAVTLMHQAKEKGEPLLIHCAKGTQRTGGVVAAYRLLVEKKSPLWVYEEMQQYGWDPNKNPELPLYLNRHMAELAKLLVKTGVLERVPNPLPTLPAQKQPRPLRF